MQVSSRLETADGGRATIEAKLLELQADVRDCRTSLRQDIGNAALTAKLQISRAKISEWTSLLQEVACRQSCNFQFLLKRITVLIILPPMLGCASVTF